MRLPLLVRVAVPQTVFNPDAVDTEVFCVNDTGQLFLLATESESFTTIDENDGTTVEHGSKPATFALVPGKSVKIADVKGWEWDGHVGIRVIFRDESGKVLAKKSYDLKKGIADHTFASGQQGRVVPPLK